MSIRRSLAWAYGSQALTLLINFGSSVALARLLSPRDMGAFAYALALSGILSIFTALNLQSYIVREEHLSRETVRSIFTLNALINIALTIVILILAAVERYWLNEHDIAAVLLIGSVGPLIGIFEFVPASLYQRDINYGLLSRVGVTRAVLGAVVTVACAALGLGAISLAIGPLASGVFGASYYTVRRWRDTVFMPSLTGFRPALVFGAQMVTVGGLAQITQRLSEIALGRSLGIASLGMYSRASNLANIVFFNVYGLATSLVFTRMSKDLRETGSLRDTFLLSMRMITAVMWPLIAGIGVLARPLVHWLYGERWVPAASVLSILMVTQFVALGFGMNWELFVLRRETAQQTRFEAIRAVFGLAAFVTGALFSITAAAAGRLAEVMLGYFLYRPHIDRLVGSEKGELERIFGESLVLTAAAVTPSLVLMLWRGWAAATSPLEIAAAVSLGGLCWAAALVLRRHPIIAEVTLLWNKVRARPSAA